MKKSIKRFIDGFNVGFLMARYCPKLADRLLGGITSSFDYLEGFRAGRAEFEQERQQEQLKELEELRNGRHSREQLDR